MKANGKIINFMVKENMHIKMELNMTVTNFKFVFKFILIIDKNIKKF